MTGRRATLDQPITMPSTRQTRGADEAQPFDEVASLTQRVRTARRSTIRRLWTYRNRLSVRSLSGGLGVEYVASSRREHPTDVGHLAF
jgi:hypothetical protein